MIEYYLLSNNEMCYNIKTQIFSRTKHSLGRSRWLPLPPSLPLGNIVCLSGKGLILAWQPDVDLRRTCQTALSVTQKDRSREHAGTSHMCRSSEPQLRIEESSNGQTGDGPRSRNPGGLSQKPDNKHKSALQAGPDTGQVHDGEEAQCTLTGNGRSVDHVQVMIMSNGSHHSSGWACWNYSGFFMHSI